MGNDEAAIKTKDGILHNSISTRKETNWQSNVFADPKLDQPTRKKLGREDNGRQGLYGDEHGSDNWQAKRSFAADMSKKEPTRPPVFDEKAADDRKMKELYGNSGY
jgi:hypothetical protein